MEMGKRLPDGTTVDIIPEVYEKIRVPGDNILKSKLVEIKIFKVGENVKLNPIEEVVASPKSKNSFSG